MFIAEKGLDIEVHDISIAAGEQLSPEFLKINPRGTIPVLALDDGTKLTENIAIATYLEAKFPEPVLIGTTPEEIGVVMMWNAICEQQGGLPIAEALRNGNPHMKGRAITGTTNYEQIPELAARGQARVAVFFEMLEQRLQSSAYVALDRFSLADITAYVFVDFARVIKARIPEGNTATQAWFDSIRARPSAAL
jgi:glutathione S-transferase